MELKGRYTGLSFDVDHKALLTFSVDAPLSALEDDYLRLKDKEVKLKWDAYSPKRSLSANAYFHTLCREIGKALGRSETFVKNRMIASDGQCDLMENGERWSIKTNLAVDKMWEQENIHVKPIGSKVENGQTLFFYAVMRPSHTYTVKEMSQLIDATVQEAKALGIPTISDSEVKRLLEAWNAR